MTTAMRRVTVDDTDRGHAATHDAYAHSRTFSQRLSRDAEPHAWCHQHCTPLTLTGGAYRVSDRLPDHGQGATPQRP